MRIAIIGSTGFIGSALKDHFIANNHTVVSVTRRLMSLQVYQLVNLLEGTDVIINLAGAPITRKWTSKYKRIIYNSRINTTRKVVEVIGKLSVSPSLFISGSAIGLYKDSGVHDELSKDLADDFLGSLCKDWEAEALKNAANYRVVILRTGLVLGNEGGVLRKMLPVFKMGFGGRIASGLQAMSWIHIHDVISIVDFLIQNKELSGAINVTAPNPVDNRLFTRLMASILKKPAFFTVPGFALKVLYGEGAEVLTKGQSANPRRLLEAGFAFKFSDLEVALQNLLVKKKSY